MKGKAVEAVRIIHDRLLLLSLEVPYELLFTNLLTNKCNYGLRALPITLLINTLTAFIGFRMEENKISRVGESQIH
jgi:hypothetical protein